MLAMPMALPRLLPLGAILLTACNTAPPAASPEPTTGGTSEQSAAPATGSAPDRGPLPHAAPSGTAAKPLSAAERERATQLCEALDDPNLDRRTRAQEQLQHDFVDVTGGTERRLEACAEWCASRVGTAPDWYNPQAKPSFDLTNSNSNQP